MAEYMSIIVMSLLTVVFFTGGVGVAFVGDVFLTVKATFVAFAFI